ncbi:PEP-CTERM sorting domain-containing protein [Piscinibacter terrae]|uniref:PEP-CTERM sorting domain-containing protein n=1 Tax=Piscinibacter terrae TaxID=2496871 RepID=A0A3N7HW37_9BURK|nr:PEP-CTERM sorting domain-containing protein [Albitalea terrae]RQP26063.1 PEP-CTERM sorting domain-containing protein [Albitalea terrae]
MTSQFMPRLALVAALAAGASQAATAATIGFDALPGNTGDSFSSIVEDGFTVTTTSGDWKQAHAYGAPLPSVFVEDLRSTPFGALQVTNGGLFTFDSLDLAAYWSGVGYEVRGWLGGAEVFDFASSQAAGGFNTVHSTSSQAIDRLTIDLSGGGPGSFNVDNIRVDAAVSPVPEPGTYGLMLLGLGLLGAFMRRRQRG